MMPETMLTIWFSKASEFCYRQFVVPRAPNRRGGTGIFIALQGRGETAKKLFLKHDLMIY